MHRVEKYRSVSCKKILCFSNASAEKRDELSLEGVELMPQKMLEPSSAEYPDVVSPGRVGEQGTRTKQRIPF